MHMYNKTKNISFLLVMCAAILSLPLLNSCKTNKQGGDEKPLVKLTPVGPDFNADSAYNYCQAQCDFGSRAMNTEGHERCKEWIIEKFKQYGCVVTTQQADLKGYIAKERTPLCTDYKQWKVCGMPPPSSGGIAVAQILGTLQALEARDPRLAIAPMTPVKSASPAGLEPTPEAVHLIAEAGRLAFADRALYVADPDFVQPPGGSWTSLIAPAYLAERAKLIGTQSMKVAQPGNPAAVKTSYAPMPDQPEYGTSHISIVDAFGNAVAMTTTIEDQFGARQMVKGFLLNNELTDFSFAPTDAQGQPIANRVQPGKRPRSSMAPTLVFDKATGELLMSGGSPGGAAIIHYTAKTLYGVLNWGLMPQQAINLPNFGSMNGPTLLEEKRFPPATVETLRARGAEVREMNMTSGLQAITRGQAHGKKLWMGGADPRREGVVMGD